jgi:hypothetical protein
MLVPYEYCMDGSGRGFPFAVYSPQCGAWLPVFAFDESKIPQVLDLGGFLGDVLVWGAAAAFVRYRCFSRREQADKRAQIHGHNAT